MTQQSNEMNPRQQPAAVVPHVLVDFDQVGTVGPLPVVDGSVKVPTETMLDLARMLKPTADALAAPALTAPTPEAPAVLVDAMPWADARRPTESVFSWCRRNRDVVHWLMDNLASIRTHRASVPQAPAAPAEAQRLAEFLQRMRTRLGSCRDACGDEASRWAWDDYERARSMLLGMATPAAPAVDALSQAERDVLAERRRQVAAEDHVAERDDEHNASELAYAAAWYASPPCARHALDVNDMGLWPITWPSDSFKPGDRRRELVKSSALAIAEVERMDRAKAKAEAKGA